MKSNSEGIDAGASKAFAVPPVLKQDASVLIGAVIGKMFNKI
jgi:hypothetical protein